MQRNACFFYASVHVCACTWYLFFCFFNERADANHCVQSQTLPFTGGARGSHQGGRRCSSVSHRRIYLFLKIFFFLNFCSFTTEASIQMLKHVVMQFDIYSKNILQYLSDNTVTWTAYKQHMDQRKTTYDTMNNFNFKLKRRIKIVCSSTFHQGAVKGCMEEMSTSLEPPDE